jgi:MoaA/NifB/PqqE/SkfB family radical SAM enzyme
MFESGLDSIKFSINAGTAATYKLIHGFDDFDKVITNLKFISNYRKEHNLSFKIYVSYVVTGQNQNECETLKELIGPFIDDIVFFDVENQGGLMLEENMALSISKPESKSPPCSMVFNRFHITWEGYLTACCVDFANNLIVADLNNSTLKESWYNETFTELRNRHIMNKLQGTLCYNCLYNKDEPVSPFWIPGKA